MANKVIKTRMQQKHDISENWAKAENFIPLIGEIIVYDDLNKFKIGDGKTNVNNLPFANGVGSIDDIALLQYYGTTNITISDSSYFTVNATGETITGLSDTGKTQTELVIPYKINGKLITGLSSDEDNISILDGNNVITKVIIPNSVTNIGGSAFRDCTSLKSINIPNNVTSIGFGAFSWCTSLTSINIPNGIRYIDTSTFRDCTSLKEINIPNNVTSIDIYVFAGCTSLTSINIPNSVTSIGENTFLNCTNLTIYCEQGSYAEAYAQTNSIPIIYTDVKADSLVNNILDDTGTGSIHQKFDGSSTLDFTGKNPALTADNVSTYFGADADISTLPRGGVGNFATSLGGKSVAKGKRSTAEGTTTVAVGPYSHTEGDNTVTLGADSHAEGYETSAEGDASHSEGSGTHAKGNHSHTEGGLTKTTTGADFGHAEGLSTEVSGKYAHSEGSNTKAQGIASHSEGQETIASGNISHSEGYKTNATGHHAHSEGGNTIASADSAHSEGEGTEATSIRSHAEGSGTKTGALVDLSQTDPDEPSSPSTGGGSGEGGGTSTPTVTKGASHSEGYRTSAFGWGSHSEGGSTIAYNHYTHAEGERTKAYGEGSHTEGLATTTGDEADLTKGKGAHAEGYATKATGNHAHAEGYGTEASGAGSHSEGGNTTASGEYAHSEGEGTTASGYASKSFGQDTKAIATRSVAGGYNAEANGDTSLSFGLNTKTTNEGEVAFGKYNKSNANTLFSIGIGQYDGEGRTNAFEVTTDGKVTIPLLQDHYTKAEIDSKVSSVYKYKGTVPSAMLLPDTNDTGDVYNTIFAGYVPIHTENNYTLTGISYEGDLTTDTEITLTFNNNVTTDVGMIPIDGADIAFWFDSSNFFIGKIISYSSNSYVVKIANLDLTDTNYGLNPCIEAIMSYSYGFSSGSITSVTLQSVHYWRDYASAVDYEYVPKGGNVAWTGSTWDSLGTTIDTSNFATKNEMNSAISSAVTATLNTEV